MKKFLLVTLITITLGGCQEEKTPTVGTNLANYFENSSLPAALMGSINGDDNIDWYAFGPSRWGQSDTVSEDHIFRIFSMTKAIASVAALQLVEKGLIDLDDPLDNLMPEMVSIPILTEEGNLIKSENPITLRQLLTHTAGFGYDITSPRIQNFKPENWGYEDKPRLFEPGTDWLYGTSTDWVGKIIEKISEKNLETYFRENITGPLQMNSTWFNVPDKLKDRIVSWGIRDSTGFKEYPRVPENPVSTFSAGGGLLGSPKDYMTFLKCMLNYGEYDGGQLLKRETIELMLKDHLPEGVKLNFPFSGGFADESDRWGLAWAIEANENESTRSLGSVYWSGAANSYYTLDAENQIAIVYFTNYFPFNDEETFNFYRLFEKEVYANTKNR